MKPIPEGMTAITPHLICAGAAAAIEFYQKAFGAVNEGAMSGPNGKIEDPFGHSWSVATHKRDLTPAQIQEGMTKACG